MNWDGKDGRICTVDEATTACFVTAALGLQATGAVAGKFIELGGGVPLAQARSTLFFSGPLGTKPRKLLWAVLAVVDTFTADALVAFLAPATPGNGVVLRFSERAIPWVTWDAKVLC